MDTYFADATHTEHERIPGGPNEKFGSGQDLLSWMGDQFGRFGDTYKASIYGTSAYVTRDPSFAIHVLRDNWRNYVKGQAIKRVGLLLGNGLMVSEGELWKTQRRMIQPAFHREAIEAVARIAAKANADLLKDWDAAAQRSENVNVTADASRTVLKVVLLSIFGDDYDDVRTEFNVLSEEAVRSLEFAQNFRGLGRVILRVAARRRERKVVPADILAVLMEARDRDTGDAMSDGQLVNEILTLVVAGHETTVSTLGWTWHLLSRDSTVADKLSEELENVCVGEFPRLDALAKFTYARQIIQEVLRLYPAGWLMTRRALHDDRLGGFFVPAGTEIYIPPYFIQRHPDIWDEPDRFNPDRFAPDLARNHHAEAMFPFSAGPRNCIGEHFAQAVMQIHLVTIARHLRLRCSEATPPELGIGVNLRAKHDFIMTPETRSGRLQ